MKEVLSMVLSMVRAPPKRKPSRPPSCAMWGLRPWADGFKSQLHHSLAGGFVQSLTTSVPVPLPQELTAPTSQSKAKGGAQWLQQYTARQQGANYCCY